jgi:hypothetical protein
MSRFLYWVTPVMDLGFACRGACYDNCIFGTNLKLLKLVLVDWGH